MILPPFRIVRQKDELAARLPPGMELGLRVHEIDPDDATGLVSAAVAQVEASRPADALRLFWRLATVHPYLTTPYTMTAVLEEDVNRERALAAGLVDLASRKHALHLAARKRRQPAPSEPVDSPARDLEALLERIRPPAGPEPARVAARLLPFRRAHEVEAAESALPRDLVKRVLAHAAECAPLLRGLLRGWVDEAVGDFVAIAAVALLGEIGDPAEAGTYVQLLPMGSTAVGSAAEWALRNSSPVARRDLGRFPLDSTRGLADFAAIRAELGM